VSRSFLTPPRGARYVLRNVRVAPNFLVTPRAGWNEIDIVIDAGCIVAIAPAGAASADEVVDLARGIVMSATVDGHAHLDKAHLADAQSFPEDDLLAAITAMEEGKRRWTAASLRARANIALASAYAHGVRAIRTHVDWRRSTPDFVWPVMCDLRREWRDKIELQLAPLIPIDETEDEALFQRALAVAPEGGGVIGFFVYRQELLDERLANVMRRAGESGLDLDFHVDEGLDPALRGVPAVIAALAATRFAGRVVLGHCIALSLNKINNNIINKIMESNCNITIISLPLTSLHLQDRAAGHAPRRRGLAPIRELAASGLRIAIGTDNVRDGFFPYGDHDPIAALGIGALAAQLPDPALEWAHAITTTPARAMGFAWDGVLAPGAPADLLVFEARTSSELFARGGLPRQVIRGGRFVTADLPSLRRLDNFAP
jgi:cytosine deaminase